VRGSVNTSCFFSFILFFLCSHNSVLICIRVMETKGELTCVQNSEKKLETVLVLRQALFLAPECDLSAVSQDSM